MKRLIMAAMASIAVAGVAIAQDQEYVKLPGEDCRKPAIAPDPFPDRISAFVWRNWNLVSKDRLAKIVGATPAQITEIAADMGLADQGKILPEWHRRGYITVLRRNWHLLPYDQIMQVIDMNRKELAFSLIEDDFLIHKLGHQKPFCEPLKYDAAEVAKTRPARLRLAQILKEEGVAASAPEEPRFEFAHRLSEPDPTLKPVSTVSSPFEFRLISSYFADYCDPLGDEDIRSFPEGLLQRLSVQGVNAVWLHTVLRTLAKDPKYPEFGEGCERRLVNLQKLVDRAGKYGIKVFLYMNEPRGLDPEFFKKPGRAEIAGAVHGRLQAMCTSCPETTRWVKGALRHVFSTVHGLGGIFTITASENLTNCSTRPKDKETCPRCKNRTRAEIIADANNALISGMLEGDPKAEALVWNWAWPRDEEEEIVRRLPTKNVRLMAVSENDIEINRGGVKVIEGDYSISIVGPGERARNFWNIAKKYGEKTVAKVQANSSWELCTFPYIPVMDLVARHASNLANEGLAGVMLAWSVGGCPAPNLTVYRDIRKGETSPEPLLDRMAKELYGEKNAARARKAWKAFSDGFANYPFSTSTIYVGPHHWGPANPLFLKPTGYGATMTGIPYDGLRGWRSNYPAETYIDLMQKVADGFAEGCRLMEGVADDKELAMYRAEQIHFASSADQARFVMARDAGDKATMKEVAKRELARAKEFLPIVRADSRIGYESSNHYFYVPCDIVEKVLSCRAAIDD